VSPHPSGAAVPWRLEAVLAQLDGFPAAAAAWESEILPARLRGYTSAWLDQLCSTGRIVWQRLPQGGEGRKASPVRATPVALLAREHASHWQAEADAEPELSSAAAAVLDALDRHGASFFVELVEDSGQLRTQVEAALGELVSHGLVSSDGFAGLRALIAPADVKARSLRRGGVRAALQGLEAAGRWSRVRRRGVSASDGETRSLQLEFVARTLLRRYGVVFRALLEREPRLPPWRELFYVLRRLEARDEIRGGRFVSGFAGEQFALPRLRRHCCASARIAMPRWSLSAPPIRSISPASCCRANAWARSLAIASCCVAVCRSRHWWRGRSNTWSRRMRARSSTGARGSRVHHHWPRQPMQRQRHHASGFLARAHAARERARAALRFQEIARRSPALATGRASIKASTALTTRCSNQPSAMNVPSQATVASHAGRE
jgi:hypothetical protein